MKERKEGQEERGRGRNQEAAYMREKRRDEEPKKMGKEKKKNGMLIESEKRVKEKKNMAAACIRERGGRGEE